MKNKSRTQLFSILVLLLSFTIISCSGGGSSNGEDSEDNRIECSNEFGDASRCDARGDL